MKQKILLLSFLLFQSFLGKSQNAIDTIFHPPEFGNEEQEFYVYLENSLNTNPDMGRGTQNGQQVTIFFEIDTFGKPTNIDVGNNADLFLINQLKNAISRMPEWYPANQRGIKVQASMNYFVNIRYDGAGHYVVEKAKLLPQPNKENLALRQAVISCTVIVFLFYIIGVVVN